MPETARRRLPSIREAHAALAVCLALVLGGSLSCRNPAREAAPAAARPLVVIGVDGLEWRLVLEMASTGRLPQISSLAAEGTFARLATLEPALSPPIWTSMATGVLPARHGIVGFVRPGERDADGRPLLLTSRERRVKALWNIAHDAGLRACVVGYWMTFPVEHESSVMVAQTGTPPGGSDPARKGALRPGVSGQVHPVEYESRVFELADASADDALRREHGLFGEPSSWPPAMRRLVEHSRWSLAADSAYQRIALDLAGDRTRCDVLIVYLGLPDVLGHRFWRWTYPEDFATPPSQEEVERYGDVLRHAYEQVDGFVGDMRRAAGTGATVAVVSDHGMGFFRPKVVPDLSREDGPLIRTGGHSAARDALLVAAGPVVRKGPGKLPATWAGIPRAGSVIDVAPTLLALLGLPRGADMDGRVMTPLLDPRFVDAHPPEEIATHTPADWMQTRKLAVAEDPASAERLEQLRGLGYLE